MWTLVDENNERRLRLAFTVKHRADPDADFDEFSETVVNSLLREALLTELPSKKRTT